MGKSYLHLMQQFYSALVIKSIRSKIYTLHPKNVQDDVRNQKAICKRKYEESDILNQIDTTCYGGRSRISDVNANTVINQQR